MNRKSGPLWHMNQTRSGDAKQKTVDVHLVPRFQKNMVHGIAGKIID